MASGRVMHDPNRHPDDERLSALAGGDDDVLDDRPLRDHVAECTRCSAIVDELLALRTALSQLPAIKPPRPLRLLPPAPEPRPERSAAGTLARRLFAPALAAGIVLAVGGGIGTFVDRGIPMLTSAGAGAVAAPESQDLSKGGEPQPAAAPSDNGTTFDGLGNGQAKPPQRAGERQSATDRPAPWLPILGAGVALIVLALILRFAVQPRAG